MRTIFRARFICIGLLGGAAAVGGHTVLDAEVLPPRSRGEDRDIHLFQDPSPTAPQIPTRPTVQRTVWVYTGWVYVSQTQWGVWLNHIFFTPGVKKYGVRVQRVTAEGDITVTFKDKTFVLTRVGDTIKR